MAGKHVLFRSEAREKVLHGATLMTDAVRITLGPKSKCVLIEKKWGAPLVCNDGVTIAKEFELADAEENMGVKMLLQAAERTGNAVGDGTSTATLLAHALYAEGVRNIAARASAIDIKRGLDRGLKVALDALKLLARPVQSSREKIKLPRSRPTTTKRLAVWLLRQSKKSAPMAWFLWKRPREQKRPWNWLRARNSTAVIFPPISLPIHRMPKWFWRIRCFF